MKTCDLCNEPIVDSDGTKILDDPVVPILAHVRCWEAHQANIKSEFKNRIAIIDSVGGLRELINNLPHYMRVHLKIGSKRGVEPTVGVEKYGDEYVLEIRS